MFHHPCVCISEAGQGTLNSKTHGASFSIWKDKSGGSDRLRGLLRSSVAAAAAGVLRTLSSVLQRGTCRSLKRFAP